MIKDLYSYLANRGIAVLDPDRVIPEREMRRYFHESAGLQPWLGSEADDGPAMPLGDSYMPLTEKSLKRPCRKRRLLSSGIRALPLWPQHDRRQDLHPARLGGVPGREEPDGWGAGRREG